MPLPTSSGLFMNSSVDGALGYCALRRLDTARPLGRTQLNLALHTKPVGIAKQFLYAHFADPAMQEITDIGLVFVQHLYEISLGEPAPVNFSQNRFEDGSLNLQCRRFGLGKSEVVEDISRSDVI